MMSDLLHNPDTLRLAPVVCLLMALLATQCTRAIEPAPGPHVTDGAPRDHPRLAATAEELARLRAAWESEGPAHDALAKIFTRADHVIDGGLVIPPEGGQHNQWYQCEPCQMGLKTVNPTTHRCPKCGKVYSGYPYDNVLYNRRHLQASWRMNDAGWAYAVTGDIRYAKFVARILLQYAEMYPRLPVQSPQVGRRGGELSESSRRSGGKINPQTLTESMWLTTAAPAYDLIYNAGVLTDAQKQTIETDLFAAMAGRIGDYHAGKSNWQTWHNAALLHAGAVTGDAELIRRAIDDPDNGFTRQMEISVLPEGMWYENSWGYHYYTLLGMTRLTEGARRLGIDLYSHPMLRKMYLIGFDYRLSDGRLPRFGDATGSTPRNHTVNEPAFSIYGDQRILSTLPDRPTFDSVLYGRDTTRKAAPPAVASKLFPGAGHAILHSNGPGKLSAAIAFGPYGGFHGHFDKLGFVFYGYGREFGVDPGRAASQAYRLPIHSRWYKATIGHNTLMVDGTDQAPATGELFAYAATDAYAAVVAGAGEVYKGVDHTRLLLLTPAYLLIVDELDVLDGRPRAVDWVYHNRGDRMGMACRPSAAPAESQPNALPTTYLQDIRHYTARPGEPIVGAFVDKPTRVHMTSVVHGGADTDLQVTTATGPLGSVAERAGMVIIRHPQVRSKVYIVTALEPVPDGAAPTVSGMAVETSTSGLSVRVEGSGWVEQLHAPVGRLRDGIAFDRTEAGGASQLLLRAAPIGER